jgi:hypothetical protein
MNYKTHFTSLLLFVSSLTTLTVATAITNLAHANSEIDAEIDRLTVELKPAPHHGKKVAKPRVAIKTGDLVYKQTTVANTSDQDTKIAYDSLHSANQSSNQSQINNSSKRETDQEIKYSVKPKSRRGLLGLISRFTLLPFATISTFDGQDQNSISQNQSDGSNYATNFSGAALVDLNFGSSKLVGEAGVNYFTTGSNTDYPNSYVYSYAGLSNRGTDAETFHYVGIPLHMKYFFSGENKTSLYLKGGGAPSFLVKSQYQNFSGPSYIGSRFGSFSNFDMVFDAELGLALPIYSNYGLIVEGGYFHGILPVTSAFNLYNTGFTIGAGLSYSL